MLKKKKKPQLIEQGPWLITTYSDIQNAGTDDEFDPGYIEFEHKENDLSLKKEMAEFRGEGAFVGRKPPNLLDVWKTFIRYTPGTKVFVYKNWHVTRDPGCFIIQLADKTKDMYVYKNIVSNYSCQQQDFISFLGMLDNTQKQYEEDNKNTILSIEEMRTRRKIT